MTEKAQRANVLEKLLKATVKFNSLAVFFLSYALQLYFLQDFKKYTMCSPIAKQNTHFCQHCSESEIMHSSMPLLKKKKNKCHS